MDEHINVKYLLTLGTSHDRCVVEMKYFILGFVETTIFHFFLTENRESFLTLCYSIYIKSILLYFSFKHSNYFVSFISAWGNKDKITFF